MYIALYRSCRPEVFEEILGQEHIVKILKNQLATDTVSHAYLFCGTRGTGKTTTARILAKGVNCISSGERPCGKCANCMAIKEGIFMDVIEIDAASNNGVENIRELRESVKYPPVTGKKKVYIIDEVHMLSTGAFNALLKTLEEPPENVMFILATTEPQKLPATILSRCMRLDFKRVSEKLLKSGMLEICRQKGINADEGALKLIAANADGSVRDGLSILDQCIASGQKEITRTDVLEFLGTAGEEIFLDMTACILSRNSAEGLLLLDRVLADGKDVRQFMKDWLSHYRNLLIVKFIKNPEDILNMSCENTERIRTQSDRLDLGEINDAILELSKTIADAKWSTQPRILLELAIVKMASGLMQMPLSHKSAPTIQRLEPQHKGAMQLEPQSKVAAQLEPQSKPATQLEPQSKGAAQLEPQSKPAGYGGKGAKQKGDQGDSDSGILGEPIEEDHRCGSEAETGEDHRCTAEVEARIDLDRLWHAIFEDGEAGMASFNLIRAGTKLIELGQSNFIVMANNDITQKYVMDNEKKLESLLEKHTGKIRRLECIIESNGRSPHKTTDQIAAEVESKLGISIEIQ